MKTFNVKTIDGWFLEIKRIKIHQNASPVILWHGLSTCHKIFTNQDSGGEISCSSDGDSTSQESIHNPSNPMLAEFLALNGFDVFMANGRGNKFTKRGEAVADEWKFSLDEGVLDVQAVVDEVLRLTGKISCIFIGFSQGSALGLAALSLYHELNHKISHFIGLAPALKPASFNKNLTDFIAKGPHNLSLIFGSQSFLPVASYVSDNFPAQTFITTILGWKLDKYGPTSRQLLLYRNIFGQTSTKTFIHWFQILSAGKFQLYDQRHQLGFEPTNPKTSIPPLQFPLNHITTKISLYCGGEDNLSDLEYMRFKLPQATLQVVDGYEHLDLIWAMDADERVWKRMVKEMGNPFGENRLDLESGVVVGMIPTAYF